MNYHMEGCFSFTFFFRRHLYYLEKHESVTNYLDHSLFMANSEIVPMQIVFSLSDPPLVSEFIIRKVFFSINGFLAFISANVRQ